MKIPCFLVNIHKIQLRTCHIVTVLPNAFYRVHEKHMLFFQNHRVTIKLAHPRIHKRRKTRNRKAAGESQYLSGLIYEKRRSLNFAPSRLPIAGRCLLVRLRFSSFYSLFRRLPLLPFAFTDGCRRGGGHLLKQSCASQNFKKARRLRVMCAHFRDRGGQRRGELFSEVKC